MSEHIVFSEIEREDAVDRRHLTHCSRCAREWTIYRLLRFQIRSTPRLEIPVTFASRMIGLIQTVEMPWALLLTLTARRLTPIFSALLLCLTFLLFTPTEADPEINEVSNLLLEETLQPAPDQISLEYVVDSLRENSEEEYFDRSL